VAKKITELAAISSVTALDVFPLVDDSDVTTKRATVQQLRTKEVNTQVVAYQLLSTDVGKIVTISNGSPVNVTVPALGAGFHCVVHQLGAGQVTFVTSGTTLRNRSSHTKIAGQYGRVTVEFPAAAEFVLSGDTSA
jgi:hypothetical protein